MMYETFVFEVYIIRNFLHFTIQIDSQNLTLLNPVFEPLHSPESRFYSIGPVLYLR